METTREYTQEINKLIEKNNDAYFGYKNAAENVNHQGLKAFLSKKAEQRQRYASELSQEVNMENPTIDTNTSGSLGGALHRGLMDIKAAVSTESEEQVLEECLRGEKASMEEYHEVLQNANHIPEAVCQKIKRQHDEIHETVNTVKRLEDLH